MPGELQPQPAKRTRLRSDERRASILNNAKHVFARCNYAEASTGELARESGVTEPMLYKHFGSKKGLFLAVLREFSPRFLKELQEHVTQKAEKDILDALEHVVDDYRAAIKADPEIQRIVFQAVTESGDPDIAGCVSKHNLAVYGIIRQLVAHAHEEGYLDPAISQDAATWGYMSMILATQYGLMLNLSSEIAKSQEEISRVWLRGLRTQRG